MRNQVLWSWGLGLVLAGTPVAGNRSQEAPGQLTNTSPAVVVESKSNIVAQATAAPAADIANQDSEAKLADAAFQPIASARPLPENIKPTAPVAEVIRLAQAGLEQGVILAFVTNSVSTFRLGAEDIVYLNDIGVPSAVVTAMIQRDQALKGFPAGSTTAAAPAPDATAPQFAPVAEAPAAYPPTAPAVAPDEMAPAPPSQPEYASEDYSVPPPAEEASYSTFYGSLSPYGNWVNVAGCGPCWQPTAVVGNPGWQPYCNGGHWVYTDCGWYWLSDYSWGWAPFHYGRWFRHSRLGWCWAPDNVWGPSWVCWRYTASHCGWAPLPPGALYRAGSRLTYRGRQVASTFGFGLGARSFAFVEFGHLWDRRLPQYALPAQQKGQLFSRTVASTSIVGGKTGVINSGLPPTRVVAATHTGIRRVTIHDTSVGSGLGVRAERLDPNGKTLSLIRPNLPPGGGTPPTSGARVGTAGRNSSSVAASPLILRGAEHSNPVGGGTGGSAAKETYPPNSLIMTGRREGASAQGFNHSAAPIAQPHPPQTTAASPNSSSRSEMNPRPQTRATYSGEFQRPAYSSWSAPAPAPVGRSSAAPSDQAAEIPRSAPAPSYTPPHTYTPPAVSYTPHATVTESHPAYSAPSAPPAAAASAPASYSHSSSGKNGR